MGRVVKRLRLAADILRLRWRRLWADRYLARERLICRIEGHLIHTSERKIVVRKFRDVRQPQFEVYQAVGPTCRRCFETAAAIATVSIFDLAQGTSKKMAKAILAAKIENMTLSYAEFAARDW